MNGAIVILGGDSDSGTAFHRLATESRERLRRAEALRQEVASIVGVAESPDGLLRVTCTPTEGVSELHISPRAMRMDPTELAEALIDLIGQARDELETQTRQAISEALGTDFALGRLPEPQASRQRLERASDAFRQTNDEALTAVENVARRMDRGL